MCHLLSQGAPTHHHHHHYHLGGVLFGARKVCLRLQTHIHTVYKNHKKCVPPISQVLWNSQYVKEHTAIVALVWARYSADIKEQLLSDLYLTEEHILKQSQL